MAYLTILGALAGSPTEIDLATPPGLEEGKEITASSGCLGCHKIGENGNTLGPNLTEIGVAARQGRDRAHAREPHAADAVLPASSGRSNPEQFNKLVAVRRLAQGRVS